MKPPICCVCDKNLDHPNEGELIYFKKRKSDIDWDKRMEKIQGVGHPPYAEWFCKEHYEKAKDMTDNTIDVVIKYLKKS